MTISDIVIQNKIKEFREEFDSLFQTEIDGVFLEVKKFSSFQPELDDHLFAATKEYAKDGKRIRPFIISYFSNGNVDSNTLLQAMLALEMFHLSALIHDDIIDDANERHSTSTLHTFSSKFQKHKEHFGSDIAILTGDSFMIQACRYASQLPKHASDLFFEMTQRTIRGQYFDILSMNEAYGSVEESLVRARHELKTAWYTFVTPTLIALTLSQYTSQEETEHITKMMKEIGILFQIRDDIIDCIDPKNGKGLFTDIFENQTTWVTLYIKENHPELFQKIVHTRDTKELSDLFENIPLRSHYEELFKKTKEKISTLPIKNEYRSKVEDLFLLLKLPK